MTSVFTSSLTNAPWARAASEASFCGADVEGQFRSWMLSFGWGRSLRRIWPRSRLSAARRAALQGRALGAILEFWCSGERGASATTMVAGSRRARIVGQKRQFGLYIGGLNSFSAPSAERAGPSRSSSTTTDDLERENPDQPQHCFDCSTGLERGQSFLLAAVPAASNLSWRWSPTAFSVFFNFQFFSHSKLKRSARPSLPLAHQESSNNSRMLPVLIAFAVSSVCASRAVRRFKSVNRQHRGSNPMIGHAARGKRRIVATIHPSFGLFSGRRGRCADHALG